jgi:hypothetical protein
MLYLISKLDLKAICEILTQMDLALLSLSLPFIALMYLIKARKWQTLLNCINVQIPIMIVRNSFDRHVLWSAPPSKLGEVSRVFYLDIDAILVALKGAPINIP